MSDLKKLGLYWTGAACLFTVFAVMAFLEPTNSPLQWTWISSFFSVEFVSLIVFAYLSFEKELFD